MAAPILARTSEYGDNRIVLGFHYPLDVIGSRMTSQATVAHRWADEDFAELLQAAHEEIESVLLAACEEAGYGDTLTECAGDSYDGMTEAEDVSVYTERLSYGFTRVAEEGQEIEVPAEASALLITAFPDLTDEQRAQVLAQTAIDSGYPLDQTADGEASWQRINLAAAMTADIVVDADGTVTVTGYADETAASVSTAAAIQVAGTEIDGFDSATRTYVVDWPADEELPEVSATATESGSVVTVSGSMADTLLQGISARLFSRAAAVAAPERTIEVTSASGEFTTSYRVVFALTDDADGTDPGDGGTDPGDGGTDPGDGGTNPGDGGTDPGDGGTNPGDGGSTNPGDGNGAAPDAGGNGGTGANDGSGVGGGTSGATTPSSASGSDLAVTGGDVTAAILFSALAALLLAGGAVVRSCGRADRRPPQARLTRGEDGGRREPRRVRSL